MRNYKFLLPAIVCLILVGGLSCKKYLTVEPRLNVIDEQFFVNQTGFKEVLNGVYLRMGEPALYGRELTFGITDVMAGMYLGGTVLPTQYNNAFTGNYANSTTTTVISNLWSTAYNTLANINKLIFELEEADTSLFTGNNYKVIKGEAYGLRAMLHFDLLRLFGKSKMAGGMTSPAIPYVTTYSKSITPKTNGDDVMTKIKADLMKSADLLKADPMYTRIESLEDNGYLQIVNRRLRFNYYAAKALQARVAMWEDDKTTALAAAEEVIAVANTNFPWVLQSNVATATEATRDRIFTTENIFTLYVNSIALNYAALLDTSKFTSRFHIDANRITQQFEGITTDYRSAWLIRTVTGLSTNPSTLIFFGKLYQPANMTAAYAKRVPLIRIPEMYYIAAECLIATDPQKAILYLNTVRQNRGISAILPNSLTAAAIQTEIRKEYWKEFPLEGQMFHYYKRTGATSIPGSLPANAYPQDRYVLPLPANEIEFGG